jgi:DNA-binding NtrC family response regulator
MTRGSSKNSLSDLLPILPLYFGKQEYDQLCIASKVNSNILITGNQGLPFELAAQFVHFMSDSRNKPFIAIDYITNTDAEFEKELFGSSYATKHSSKSQNMGLLQNSNGGSLYFSELSVLSPNQQLLLMNIVERGHFYHVESRESITLDTRIIGKTDQNIDESIQKGIFRKDFYFWVSKIAVNLASLRNRKEDIPTLSYHLLQIMNSTHGKFIKGFTEEASDLLNSYTWSGEIIQLENAIEHAVIFCASDLISSSNLPEYLRSTGIDKKHENNFVTLKEATDEFQKQLIFNTLKSCSFNKENAANQLGIGISTLYRKMAELKITDESLTIK